MFGVAGAKGPHHCLSRDWPQRHHVDRRIMLVRAVGRASCADIQRWVAIAGHGLDRPDTILEDVRTLARRHTAYGVEPSHYGTVGEALLSTLSARLGADFTPDLRAAWTEAYALLAGAMMAAAAPVRSAA